MPKIAVIGCGPAGLAFALALSDYGIEVQLFERFDAPRAVGSGIVLQPTGLAAIAKLGLRKEVETRGRRIDRILGHTADKKRLTIDVDYQLLGADIYAIAMRRSALFSLLLERLESSQLDIRESTEIVEFRRRSDGRIELRDDQSQWLGPFDLIVDASGAKSLLRRQVFGGSASKTLRFGSLWATLDMPPNIFPQNTLLQRFAPGNESIGVMPLGRESSSAAEKVAFFWNIECSHYQAWLKNGLQPWKDLVLNIWPDCGHLTDQIHDAEQLTLAEYRHHFDSSAITPGLVFIGDAAHATSPQLGQGVNMSLLDALSLAEAIRAEKNLSSACIRYQQQRRRQIRIVQGLAQLLIPFYQENNRAAIALRDFCFQSFTQIPLVRYGIARTVAGLIAT